MPVTLKSHDNNNTILVYNFEGQWSWSEFIMVDDKVWNTFEQTDERTDLIFDLTHSTHIPMGVGNIMHRVGRRTDSAKKGLCIIVNPPNITSLILGTLRRLYPLTVQIYRTVSTFEDAIQLIETDRNFK